MTSVPHTFAALLESPLGSITVRCTELAVVSVEFGDTVADGLDDGSRVGHPTGVLEQAVAQLTEYFAGKRTEFDVPVTLAGTQFQKDTWMVLTTIPFGETISYGEQARRMGRPTAVRAVGAANGRNPVPVIVPCHRVIGADGSLTGFAGGLDVKIWLLAHERRVAAARGAA